MKKTSLKKTISFVIPVFNESEGISKLIQTLKSYLDSHNNYTFEIVLVENGSTDNSFELLKKYIKKDRRFKILQLSRNFECDGGIAAGMQYVSGDACVVMMADLQEPIELVDEFIKKWEAGYDIVYGIVKKRTAGSLRNFSSMLFYKVINIATNNAFPENVSDFRLVDKKVYTVINAMPEQNKYLRGLTIWTGFSHTGIPFDRNVRFAGESKADMKTVFRVAKNGIFSFSYLPLKFVTYMDISITIISFVLIIYYLVLFFINGREAPGITTILLLLLFLFGVLFFILGIISEYIARIYEEAKKRPSFIVKSTTNL